MGKNTRKNVVRQGITRKRHKGLRLSGKTQEQKDWKMFSEYLKDIKTYWLLAEKGYRKLEKSGKRGFYYGATGR